MDFEGEQGFCKIQCTGISKVAAEGIIEGNSFCNEYLSKFQMLSLLIQITPGFLGTC